MDIMELDECLLRSNNHRDHWLSSMSLSWKEGLLGIAENGLSRAWTLYDPVTKESKSPLPHFLNQSNDLSWDFINWVSGTLSGRSTMLASVGFHVAKWLPSVQAEHEVISILENVSLEQMRHCLDPDGQQLLPQHKFMMH